MTTNAQDNTTDSTDGGVIHLERISRSTSEVDAVAPEVRDTLEEAKAAGAVTDASEDPALDPPEEFDGWVARDTSIDVFGYGKNRTEALRDLSARLSEYAHEQQTRADTNTPTGYNDELPR